MKGKEFVLTNGEKFIRQNLDGKYEQVANLSMADTYETKKKAMNVMLNSIPKVMSRSYYVAEVTSGGLVQNCATRPPKPTKTRCGQMFAFEETKVEPKWYDGFLKIGVLFDTAMRRNHELSQEISDIEAQIVDLEHYIEFYSLNARDGYKVYKKLHSLFLERRKLKNEQSVVMAINKNCSASEQIKNIEQAIKKGTGNAYNPRILLDLFESGINAI